MKEKIPTLLVLLNLTVFASALAFVPLPVLRQIPHFAGYKDTSLLDSELDAGYEPSICRLTIIHRQTLETTKSKGDIWQRLPALWKGRSRIVGRGDEAIYESKRNALSEINSRVQHATRRSINGLNVRNHITLQLPEQACGWLNPE